jgi:transposase
MEYFAGLDVSMAETQVCVVTRDGDVIHEAKVASTPADIAAALAQVPTCRRVVFETGRMAPMLFHGLSQLGLPVVCVESRQAYQALKSLATHKTDRNDARGLAHLARTGFFKPVHVKSLPAHAVRSLIIARKKLVGQRVTLENQIRGLAVVFGVRLPRALSPTFVEQGARGERGHHRFVCGYARSRCGAGRRAWRCHSVRRGHEADGQSIRGLPPTDDNPGYRPANRTRLHGRNRRSWTLPAISRHRRLSRSGATSLSVRRGRLHRQHLEVRRSASANAAL